MWYQYVVCNLCVTYATQGAVSSLGSRLSTTAAGSTYVKSRGFGITKCSSQMNKTKYFAVVQSKHGAYLSNEHRFFDESLGAAACGRVKGQAHWIEQLLKIRKFSVF